MTVSQSKGLEFDDVFLVDFFHDSPADEEWRLLSTFLDDLQKDEVRISTLASRLIRSPCTPLGQQPVRC